MYWGDLKLHFTNNGNFLKENSTKNNWVQIYKDFQISFISNAILYVV